MAEYASEGEILDALNSDLETEEEAVRIYTLAVEDYAGTPAEKHLKKILGDEYRHVSMLKQLLLKRKQ